MKALIPLPVAVPLALAAIAVLFPDRRALQRVLGFGGALAMLALGTTLVVLTADGTTVASQIGGWPPGFAIPLAADAFSALMLVVSALMVLACLVFAVARGEDRSQFFHPLVLVLAAGIAASFLTADLFNLFVAFEVMLIASYVLLTRGAAREQIRAGTVYVITNLMASTLFLVGVALIYGAAGTVALGPLAGAARGSGSIAVGGVLLLVAFAVKGSLVPVHGWLPVAYPAASPAVAALFSGLLTKVGIYALFRVYAVLFAGDVRLRPVILVVASVTMVIGVLGAVGREGMREILSFHIVSQVGYMVMGLGLFGPLGLAGGIFYILHHIVVKTSLFLTAGAVETIEGTGALEKLGGLARRSPMLAIGFVAAALSLAGLPPLSGFFAKLALVRAAFAQGEAGVAIVAVAVSFFTLLSMLKIWTGAFWGQPRQTHAVAGGSGSRRLLVAPAVALAAVSVALGLGAEGLFRLSTTAAASLLDPSSYVEAVLSP